MNPYLPPNYQDIDEIEECPKCDNSGITEDEEYCDCPFGQARVEDEHFKHKEQQYESKRKNICIKK